MKTLPRSEHYTDKGCYAVMTRMLVADPPELIKKTIRLQVNSDFVVSTNFPPTLKNCRIADGRVGWSYGLVLLRFRGEPEQSPQ